MRRVSCLLIASAVLLACGGEKANEPIPPDSGSGDDFVIRIVGEPAGELDGGIHRPSPPEEDLLLSVDLARSEFESGEELPAKLTLRNVQQDTVKLLDPSRSLPANLRYNVRLPDGAVREIRIEQEIPADEVTEEDLVTIGSGESVSATIDIAPVLLELGGGRPGRYTVQIAFTGGHEGGRLTMDVWNRAGAKEAVAPPAIVWLRWPSDLADAGISYEFDQEVEAQLAETDSRGRMEEGAHRRLADLGPGVYPSIVRKLRFAASTGHARQVIGWNAFRFLQSCGGAAVESLLTSPDSDSPIVEILRASIEAKEAQREGLGLDPEEEEFREAVLDEKTRGSSSFRLTRVSDEGRDVEILTVHGDGLVQLERHQNGEIQSADGRLKDGQIRALLEGLVADGYWLHRAVRQIGSEDEAYLELEQLQSGDGEEGDLVEVVRGFEVWEGEALYFNTALGRIVKALRSAKLALGR